MQRGFVPAQLTISTDYLQFASDGGSEDVAISANFAYDVDINCDWVVYTRRSTGITVTVAPSLVCESRSAEIRIYNQKYDISQTIIVDQVPFIPRFEIDEISTLEFSYTGGAQMISLVSNFEYDVISNADWLTIDKSDVGVKVTVTPIYPVLNRPRSTSIKIVDRVYGYGEIEIFVSQRGKESDYKIGEMLEFGGVLGVVFYSDAHMTKVVSVEQSKASWSSEFNVVGASDYDNGANNMAVVQGVSSWKSKYPAFAWCANLGESWYLPAYNELYALWEVCESVNATLTKNGYTTLGADPNYYYWSSTESDNNNAFKLYFTTGVGDHYYKYSEYFIRAIYAF